MKSGTHFLVKVRIDWIWRFDLFLVYQNTRFIAKKTFFSLRLRTTTFIFYWRIPATYCIAIVDVPHIIHRPISVTHLRIPFTKPLKCIYIEGLILIQLLIEKLYKIGFQPLKQLELFREEKSHHVAVISKTIFFHIIPDRSQIKFNGTPVFFIQISDWWFIVANQVETRLHSNHNRPKWHSNLFIITIEFISSAQLIGFFDLMWQDRYKIYIWPSIETETSILLPQVKSYCQKQLG